MKRVRVGKSVAWFQNAKKNPFPDQIDIYPERYVNSQFEEFYADLGPFDLNERWRRADTYTIWMGEISFSTDAEMVMFKLQHSDDFIIELVEE